jgi:alkylhydroperoxidase/carboxymuconolactone decarboxylase family protein YurZ
MFRFSNRFENFKQERVVKVSAELPSPVKGFRDDYKEVWQAFTELGDSCHRAGPLDERTRRLVKLALAVGAGLEGGTHSAVRNAVAAGISPEEMKHVAILGITTIGLPASMRALTWIGDGLSPEDDSMAKS